MPKIDKIRALNDAFRTTFRGGKVLVTPGISDRPDLVNILRQVQSFADFNPENDPYGEHDFGAFKVGNDQLFFKIDYYDLDREYGSPDASDTSVTSRTLTVMLGSEY